MKILSEVLKITLLISLVFIQGCTDHVNPRSTQLTTLPFVVENGRFIFSLQGDQLGDSPVKEYGIVYTSYFRGVGNHNIVPTVDDSRIEFSLPLIKGVNKFDFGPNFFNGRTFFYYCAYVISADDKVVYGNTIAFTLP